MVLKPQDVVVLLKLFSLGGRQTSFAVLAKSLYMSASEVHAAVRRARMAELYNETTEGVIVRNLAEFILHGVRYAFPAVQGGKTRGLVTAYAAPPLNSRINAQDALPPVWPWGDGPSQGLSVEPLYRSVPKACAEDRRLYELLALVDGIRIGKVRERRIASELLESEISGDRVPT